MTDSLITELVKALPIMQSGKPRRFSRFCECFEWTFNHEYVLYYGPSAARIARQIEHAGRVAGDLWDHQRDNPDIFSAPKKRARAAA